MGADGNQGEILVSRSICFGPLCSQPCIQLPGESHIMSKAASMILLYFSAPSAETQLWGDIHFPELFAKSRLFETWVARRNGTSAGHHFTHQVSLLMRWSSTSSPKSWKTMDIKSYLYPGFQIKPMYKPLHCIEPKSCSYTRSVPSEDKIWKANFRYAPDCRLWRSHSFCLSWSSPILSAHDDVTMAMCSPFKGSWGHPCARTDGICRQQLS